MGVGTPGTRETAQCSVGGAPWGPRDCRKFHPVSKSSVTRPSSTRNGVGPRSAPAHNAERGVLLGVPQILTWTHLTSSSARLHIEPFLVLRTRTRVQSSSARREPRRPVRGNRRAVARPWRAVRARPSGRPGLSQATTRSSDRSTAHLCSQETWQAEAYIVRLVTLFFFLRNRITNVILCGKK